MFESLALPISDSEKMFIRHPVTDEVIKDNDGNEAYILLRSSSSKEAKAAQRKIYDRRIKMKKQKLSLDDLEEEKAEYLSAMIVGWRLVKSDGSVLDKECNNQNCKAFLLEESAQWIRDQIDEFAGDLSNFLS